MNESNLVEEKKIINLTFKYSPLLFIFDQLMRITCLIAYLYYGFSAWYFLIGQIIILIITGYISDKIQEKIKTKYKKFINPLYLSLNPDIELAENIPSKLMG